MASIRRPLVAYNSPIQRRVSPSRRLRGLASVIACASGESRDSTCPSRVLGVTLSHHDPSFKDPIGGFYYFGLVPPYLCAKGSLSGASCPFRTLANEELLARVPSQGKTRFCKVEHTPALSQEYLGIGRMARCTGHWTGVLVASPDLKVLYSGDNMQSAYQWWKRAIYWSTRAKRASTLYSTSSIFSCKRLGSQSL